MGYPSPHEKKEDRDIGWGCLAAVFIFVILAIMFWAATPSAEAAGMMRFEAGTMAADPNAPGFRYGGKCGRYAKTVTGYVNETYSTTAADMDPLMGTEAMPIGAGDIVRLRTASGFHAAVVHSLRQSGDTAMMTLWESNARGRGKVSYGRTVAADDPSVVGFVPTPAHVSGRPFSALDRADPFPGVEPTTASGFMLRDWLAAQARRDPAAWPRLYEAAKRIVR